MARLPEVERALALFAEAIAGRPYHVKPLSDLPAAVAGESATAAHDGRSLYLPERIAPFGDAERDAGAYRLLVLEQLGFREFGTYRFDMSVARTRIPALAAWPPSIGDEPALAAFFAGFPAPAIARRVFRAIETARVRLAVGRRYPGALRYRQRHPAADLDATLAAIGAGGQPLAPAARPALRHGADVYASAAATVACCAALASVPDADDGAAEAGATLEMLQREARLADWDEELANLEVRIKVLALAAAAEEVAAATAAGAAEEPRDPDVDLAALVAERDRKRQRADAERARTRRGLGDERTGARSFRYDEWDYASRTYLRGWCRLFEARAATAEADGAALLRTVRPHAQRVRRRFEQMRPSGYQRLKKTSDGDELDIDAVIEAHVDMCAGVAPDERLHSRRERLRRDVAAGLLVDLSASTDDIVALDAAPAAGARDTSDSDRGFKARMAADAAKRRVIDIEREAALVMATAFEGLGDRYAVYGFSGYGRDRVEFTVAKDLDEPLRSRAIDAIAAMKPKRSTRMGPAVRHATAKLAASGAALKVLLIVSDGFPQDHDYGPVRGDHEHGLQDTAQALREAGTQGVETFCVTVDRSGHDYLRRMCPAQRYMVIEETSELAEALQVAYRRLTHI